MSRLIMHVDLDAFYAAVEQRDHPPWRGLPVVVGAEPGRRGVVATCSYEARRYGVHSAMPISEAVRRLPPETVYVRPRMADYARVSRQIMGVLATISPVVEQVSIDEAYLDVSGMEGLVGPPEVIARRTKAAIREAVGLTASVGIGPNRLIAKLASDFRKPDGLTVVPAEGVADFLDPMPLAGAARGRVQDGTAAPAPGPGDGRRCPPPAAGGAAPTPGGTGRHRAAPAGPGDRRRSGVPGQRAQVDLQGDHLRRGRHRRRRCCATRCSGPRRRSGTWPATRDARGRW